MYLLYAEPITYSICLIYLSISWRHFLWVSIIIKVVEGEVSHFFLLFCWFKRPTYLDLHTKVLPKIERYLWIFFKKSLKINHFEANGPIYMKNSRILELLDTKKSFDFWFFAYFQLTLAFLVGRNWKFWGLPGRTALGWHWFKGLQRKKETKQILCITLHVI